MKNLLLSVLAICILASCQSTKNQKGSKYLLKENFEKEIDGKKISLYMLENEKGMKVYFTNYGARVVALFAPDKDGKFDDIVLGQNNIEDYLKDKMYLGCIVGRYANRINHGRFTLDGIEYQLSVEGDLPHLHGGAKGFYTKVWDVDQQGNQITFSYLSPDGEEGYPGNLKVKKSYILTNDNELKIEYEAETDKPTIINLSHHGYFNLKGEGDTTILDHYLILNADAITPVDNTLIPTGELMPVENTPFDFRQGKQIGQDINQEDEQLKYGLGYDHNWALNKTKEDTIILAAKLWEETTGRVIEIFTSEPGIQFYSGNFMNGTIIGKSGKPYKYRAALALETQHYPDSPNHENFPSTVLRPGEKYHHIAIYKFGIIQ